MEVLCDSEEKYWHYNNITAKSESQFIKSYKQWAKKVAKMAGFHKFLRIYYARVKEVYSE